MKELRLHTLRGDIQTCGMDGMTKPGIRRLLENRYVNPDSDITEEEFNRVLGEEYSKVASWRIKTSASNKGKTHSPEDREKPSILEQLRAGTPPRESHAPRERKASDMGRGR